MNQYQFEQISREMERRCGSIIVRLYIKYQKADAEIYERVKKVEELKLNHEQWMIVDQALSAYNDKSAEYGKVVRDMVFELVQLEKAAPLFEGWQETLIWSCLQGVMGKVYVTSLERPASAVAVLGDFCFLAGKPDREMVLREPEKGWSLLIPQNDGWAKLIEECYGEKAKKLVRYAIKKEPDIFDKERLEAVVAGLPDGYVLKMMDEALFSRCRENEWCQDWVSQYKDYEMYQKRGLGVVIEKDGEIVSGASSYSGYIGGIEIEIDTREDYRRRGLAYICGAKLVLECLGRGWYPSWDAQNQWSVALAEKLGYHFDHEYVTYVAVTLGGNRE